MSLLCVMMLPTTGVAESKVGMVDKPQPQVLQDLSWISAIDTLPITMDTAPDSTMPGKLRAYRDAHLALVKAIQNQYVLYAEVQRLSQLSADQVEREFPFGNHDTALLFARNGYRDLRRDAALAEGHARRALEAVTGGRRLSDSAMQQLHFLLGL